MDSKKSYLLIFIAAALWGCIGVFLKLLTKAGLSSMQSVAVRVSLSAIFYAVFLAVTDRKALKIDIRHIYYFIGTGVFSIILFNICYFNAIKLSSMSVAAVLLYTAPIFVTMMSAVLFKEKITWVTIAALAVTFGGCILVTGVLSDSGITVKAILFGLGSGIGYALYSIFGKYALKKYSSQTVTVYTFVVASIVALPLSGIWQAADCLIRPDALIGALGISVICCILPYVFYTKGLEKVDAGKASIIATVEPVVASFFGVAAYNEQLTAGKVIGIIMVVSAVVLLNLKTGSKQSAEK